MALFYGYQEKHVSLHLHILLAIKVKPTKEYFSINLRSQDCQRGFVKHFPVTYWDDKIYCVTTRLKLTGENSELIVKSGVKVVNEVVLKV
jgi:hypothetical protein